MMLSSLAPVALVYEPLSALRKQASIQRVYRNFSLPEVTPLLPRVASMRH